MELVRNVVYLHETSKRLNETMFMSHRHTYLEGTEKEAVAAPPRKRIRRKGPSRTEKPRGRLISRHFLILEVGR